MTAPPADRVINRELSWLAFNERVLAEATNPDVPLLERVKFAAITASNLDEFFMVRVANLKRAIEEEDTAPDLSGLTPAQQLAAVHDRARAMMSALYEVTGGTLLPGLAEHNIRIRPWPELDAARQSGVSAFFRDAVLPVLTPLAIDVSRPFPLLSSLSLNLAVLLDAAPGETAHRLGIVQVPPGLTRLVPVAAPGDVAFVLLEDVIRNHLSQLFPGQTIVETAGIRLARDAELEFDDEGGRTHLELVERELRQRRRSDIVRLEIDASATPEMVDLLRRQLDIEPVEVYCVPGPLDLRVLMGLTELPGFDALRDPPFQAVEPLAADSGDIFKLLDSRDVLLHHPYDAYDPVLALLAQAADDPDVVAIKQTLYRVSAGSPLIASLQRAAEHQKQVTVLVEVTARFDEERNIRWARALEAAGAHVIYGIRGYKTHAKILLIVKRTPKGLKRYVHLGTGNYNERTARLYTDFGLLTTSRPIADDVSAIFNAITGYSDPPRLKKLAMAPTGLRRKFLKLIDREQRRAEAGLRAEIRAKMNSLIDTEIVQALLAAARAGVKIQLNVRGICALRPAPPEAGEHLEIVSVVDRFLEHSRVYYFHNAGEEELYLASADWMTRNLDKRIETLFPIEDPEHRRTVMAALDAMFKDNVKAWRLGPDGVYHRQQPANGDPPFRVQQWLQDEARRAVSAARDRVGIVLQPEQ